MSFNASSLGGGFAGIAPTVTMNTQQGASRAAPFADASQIPRDRYLIRKAFANGYHFQGSASSVMRQSTLSQTPFRIAMNAGDPMCRQNVGGGANQVGGVGKAINLAGSFNGPSGGDGASGNQHYVYDSSTYIKYKKLSGKNRNYNDKTFGGSNNGAFSVIMRVRR